MQDNFWVINLAKIWVRENQRNCLITKYAFEKNHRNVKWTLPIKLISENCRLSNNSTKSWIRKINELSCHWIDKISSIK